MVNRITSSSRYDLLVADMQRSMYNYNKLTKQLASHSKITSITDDPINSVNVLNTHRQLGQLETFSTNVGMASAELNALDDLLGLATGYLSSAWNKAIQANNQTYSEGSLKALKVEIDETTKTMVDLANTEYNDNYIFSGANTKTLTFTMADNGDIIYNGTPHDNPDYIRQTEVADGVFETINTTGDKIFGYYKSAVEPGNGVYTDAKNRRIYESDDGAGNKVYKYENGLEYQGDFTADLAAGIIKDGAPEDAVGVMGALKKLSNSIQKVIDGDSVEGYDEMFSTLDMFDLSLKTITTEQTKFGGVANRLEMSESTLETSNDNLTAYLSTINEVDYAEAITNWLNAQYAYQASLQVASSTMNLSLLNYL